MSKKIANINKKSKGTVLTDAKNSQKGAILTEKVSRPFVVCFEHKLEKGFTFDDLQIRDLKAFQSFLDRISEMSVTDVDNMYGRKPDKQDVYNGQQIYHYEVSHSFRIHGIVNAGQFKVLRLDPRHKVHK